MHPSMNTLGRYAVVVLVLVASVVGLSLCADPLGAECAHLCCRRADRSKPLVRLIDRVRRVIASAASPAAMRTVGALRVVRTPIDSLGLAPPSIRASALRI